MPQRSLAPLHARHIQAGGESVTSMVLARLSSSPMLSGVMTFESQVIRRGKRGRLTRAVRGGVES